MNKTLIAFAIALSLGLALESGAVAAQGMPPLKGEVLEAIDAGTYTYLRLKTASGEQWAAVARVPAKKGDRLTILDPAPMENFESKTLNRTFPTIVFGTVGVEAPAATAAAPSAKGAQTAGSATSMLPGQPQAPDLGQMHAGVAKSADNAPIKVAKAEGPSGRTVAEVNAERVALKDKPVTIRAKVVKVNPEVMGKTWVHLRDGTGAAADGSNDIIVTSQDVPKVGDIVVAKGIVKTDVNLGSGYAYKVLVENASFGK